MANPPTRQLIDLDRVALLLAMRLGTITEVIPPATQTDVVAFVVGLADPDKASAALVEYEAGTLHGNVRDFAEELDRVRRMVRNSRAAAGYGRPRP